MEISDFLNFQVYYQSLKLRKEFVKYNLNLWLYSKTKTFIQNFGMNSDLNFIKNLTQKVLKDHINF